MLKKKLVAATLSLSLLIPAGVYAQSQMGHGAEQPLAQGMTKQHAEMKHGKHFAKGMHHHKQRGMMGAHHEMYMTLLAEKYTPQEVEQWEQALDEREQLVGELKELVPEKEGQAKHQMMREQMKELREKVQSGEITREEAKEKMEALRDQMEPMGPTGENREEFASMKEQRKQLHEQFTEAIKSEDAEQIASLLPKLLEHMEQRNDRLQEKLDTLKKE